MWAGEVVWTLRGERKGSCCVTQAPLCGSKPHATDAGDNSEDASSTDLSVLSLRGQGCGGAPTTISFQNQQRCLRRAGPTDTGASCRGAWLRHDTGMDAVRWGPHTQLTERRDATGDVVADLSRETSGGHHRETVTRVRATGSGQVSWLDAAVDADRPAETTLMGTEERVGQEVRNTAPHSHGAVLSPVIPKGEEKGTEGMR